MQERDWVHTNDVSRALDCILHMEDFAKIQHQAIHIGSGISTSILQIAKIILSEFGLQKDYITFIGDRPGQVRKHISSTKKAHDLLGWKAEITLEEGLKKTIEWYKQNQSHWQKMESMQCVPIYTNDEVLEIH